MANDLAKLAADINRAIQLLPGEIEAAEDKSLNIAFQLAYKYSLGTLSLYDLAKRDHPFALRHGSPQMDATIINQHTGAFAGAWMTNDPTWSGSVLHSSLVNFSREADLLQPGTKVMFNRPIDVRVATEVAPIRTSSLDAAIKRALKSLT